MKLTKYKISLISLAMVLLIALSAFFGLHFMTAEASGTASATDTIKTSGDNVSLVAAEREVSSTSGSTGTAMYYYTAFRFVNGEESGDNKSHVYYDNKLAYSWYEKGDGAEPVNNMFSMEIGFDDTNFEKFVITFESQQYLKTKDGKTANYVMFFPVEGNSNQVYVLVTQDKEAAVDKIEEDKKVPFYRDHITIEFTGRASGVYSALIKNQTLSSVNETVTSTEGVSYDFKNIGGTYARNVTSGTTVYPLMFEADFKKEAESTAATAMVFYVLNGQELASETKGSAIEGTSYTELKSLTDNKSPVLCLDNEFRYFTQGGKINFDYAAIDVLRTSMVGGKINYFILDKDMNVEEEFKEAADNDVFETDFDAYLPMYNDVKDTAFDSLYNEENKKDTEGDLYADMLVRVYVKVYDYGSTSSTSETAEIYLDWYMDPCYTVDIKGVPFIAVAKDKLGVTYNTKDESAAWDDIKKAYQDEVTKAADGLSAGSANYFYLPSAENLFKDNSTAYTDMKISIFYINGSNEQSNTSLATSNLSINVTKRGPYMFTLYAADAAGNKMYYFDKDGELVEFSTSEVWEIFKDKDKKDYLPWFDFNVDYSGVEFEEDPGMQSTGYVGTYYSSASFKINGVDYSTVYRLFYFDRALYYQETGGGTLTYEEFIEKKDELFEDASTRKYFTEIIASDKMEETDEEYKEFADYGWSNSSTSFTPQKAGFYYMVAEVKDEIYETKPVTKSLAVVVSEPSKSLKGESDWLEKNLTSVILLAVAALALIGIILLLVIKPKNKEDIDVRFEEKKKNKKDNK